MYFQTKCTRFFTKIMSQSRGVRMRSKSDLHGGVFSCRFKCLLVNSIVSSFVQGQQLRLNVTAISIIISWSTMKVSTNKTNDGTVHDQIYLFIPWVVKQLRRIERSERVSQLKWGKIVIKNSWNTKGKNRLLCVLK